MVYLLPFVVEFLVYIYIQEKRIKPLGRACDKAEKALFKYQPNWFEIEERYNNVNFKNERLKNDEHFQYLLEQFSKLYFEYLKSYRFPGEEKKLYGILILSINAKTRDKALWAIIDSNSTKKMVDETIFKNAN